MKQGCVIGSIVLAACLITPIARAAGDAEGGAAAAESLFQEARKAMDAKRYSEACPKFLASQKLASAIGTLLNLADCYEKNNQLASAWARFHEAVALAQRLNRSNREQTAKERADKLEPRLIKLTIQAKTSGSMDVKLDGNTIDPAALGTPIPVDAGKHTLEASAKGKKTYTTTVEVSETKNKSPSVEIPQLEDAPPDKVDPSGKIVEPPRERPKAGWTTQKTIGLIVGGAGVVGLGVGGFFGLRTSTQWNDALKHCKDNECDQTGVNSAAQAKSAGNIATIATIAGGALLVGGAVLFFTADSGSGFAQNKPTIRVGVGPGSIVLGGTFQ